MDDKTYYLLYRVYNERDWKESNSRLYGWTNSKKVLKAFMSQRSKVKYISFDVEKEDVIRKVSGYGGILGDTMISFIKIKSAATGEEFRLFMTLSEMRECEKRIHQMFQNLSSLSEIHSDDKRDTEFYVNMITHLDEKYYDALYFIGYRPKEIELLFDSIEDSDSGLMDIIDHQYDNLDPRDIIPSKFAGYSVLEDPANKIIYSLESFIKVMRDDL